MAVVIRCPFCKTKFRWLAETESYPSNCPECDFKTGHDRADNDVVVPNILAFSTKAMAVDARKVLASAIANAENNHNLDVDALVVSEASVGKSIVMKRFATRGRGKSTRILKPFSRLRIVVREQEEA